MKPITLWIIQTFHRLARSEVRRPCLLCSLTLAVGGAALLEGCSRAPSAEAKQGHAPTRPPVPVLVSPAVETNVPVQVRAIGNVLPYAKVTIRSQITGQLKEVHFREGQAVTTGAPLFTIDPRPAQGALEYAKANLARDVAMLENARIEFNRQTKLFESALISRDEFDKARANREALEGTVQADKAAVNGATLNLEFTSIRSPVDGVTGNLLVYAGNIVKAPDDPMLTINQIHPIFVTFGVAEQFLPMIKTELVEKPLTVEATFQKSDVPPQLGVLTFIDNTVDPTTGMIQLKATFPNQSDVLWPGQFVQVTLTLSEQPHVVVVSSQAIQNSQRGEFVYVTKADQTVEMRPVVTGITRDGQTVVEKGLQAGEIVVTDGQLRLVPGAKISISSADASVKAETAK